MNGRRVDDWDDLKRPGDYSFAKGVLWFIHPTGTWGRIASKGHGQNGEPEWDITEHDDGTVTVSPSIQQRPIGSAKPPIPGWHGYLERGVWRAV